MKFFTCILQVSTEEIYFFLTHKERKNKSLCFVHMHGLFLYFEARGGRLSCLLYFYVLRPSFQNCQKVIYRVVELL